jgi:hypothetical protein
LHVGGVFFENEADFGGKNIQKNNELFSKQE